MPKLTDTQLVILSAATRRSNGAILPPPKSLKTKGGALTSTLKGLLKKGLAEEKPAARDLPAWREIEDGRRMTLVITGDGLAALGVEPDHGTRMRAAATKAQPKKPRQRSTGKATETKTRSKTPQATSRPGTKQALLVDLLSRKDGATIAEIGKATGWQPHSVRGAISGTLKKKLGLAVTSAAVEGRGRVYHVAGRG